MHTNCVNNVHKSLANLCRWLICKTNEQQAMNTSANHYRFLTKQNAPCIPHTNHMNIIVVCTCIYSVGIYYYYPMIFKYTLQYYRSLMRLILTAMGISPLKKSVLVSASLELSCLLKGPRLL